MELVERVKKHEGFRAKPYIDPLVRQTPEAIGIPKNEFHIIQKHFDKLKVTFGYGFTNLTEEEAGHLLEYRLFTIRTELYNDSQMAFLYDIDSTAVDILVEMAFQLGIFGLKKFSNMLGALRSTDYKRAADEMLDSLWAKQTPRRAQELSDIMRSL